MPRILVVEDNLEFRGGANRYLTSRNDIQPLYAGGHDEALEALSAVPRVDGVVIDCFFPKAVGSDDISLGVKLVNDLKAEDPTERKIELFMEALAGLVDTSDLDVVKYGRFAGSEFGPDSVVVKALKQVAGVSREVATHAFKETFSLVYRENRAPKDYYTALRRAMEIAPENQPLGILIAGRAEELGVPFTLATSTYHHDELTQPIQSYASKRGWRLVDCGPNSIHEKSTPEFWARAFGELEQKGEHK